ncbi:unnamed protein product, partial [Staurois parvus]
MRASSSGHQASGHLAQQRAPRHLARAVGLRNQQHDSGHRVTVTWIVWLTTAAA